MSRKDVVDTYTGWARTAVDVQRDAVASATGTSADRQMSLDGKCSERVRTWRRRVLFRRGAQMHAAMGRDAETNSLAMLDASGIVISWYGRTRWLHSSAAEHVLERHVSQFYLPEQAAGQQPSRDLRAASLEGSTTQQGWRRDADGTAFWSTTVIKALVLRDGRLQGFSYLMSASEGPLASVPVASSLDGSSRALGSKLEM